MSTVVDLNEPSCSPSPFSTSYSMLSDSFPSYAQRRTAFFASYEGIGAGDHNRSLSPHVTLDCPQVMPLNSRPPLRSTFLAWSPKTRGLESARLTSPASPHFGGRSRFPSEGSTVSTTSTDSSGFWGDASDGEDDIQKVVSPPVPPPTPFAFKDDATETELIEERPSPPVAARIEYLDWLPVDNDHASTEHSPLRRTPKSHLYKTKPCRFYYRDRSCIKGDKCNFIHDEWDHAHRAPHPRVERRPPPPPLSTLGRRRTEGATREPHPTTTRPTELRVLPKKPTDDNYNVQGRNYYPITWRVIGGGVLMGGRREICQDFMADRCHEGTDCKFAHPGGDDSHFTALHSYASPLSPVQEEPILFNNLRALPSDHSSEPCSTLHSPFLSASVVCPRRWSCTEERRRRGRRTKKYLTIIPPPLPEILEPVGYSPHRVLDGSTLLELESSPLLLAARPDLSPDRLATASASAARIARPLSTPPSLHPQRPQIANLFAAEMP